MNLDLKIAPSTIKSKDVGLLCDTIEYEMYDMESVMLTEKIEHTKNKEILRKLTNKLFEVERKKEQKKDVHEKVVASILNRKNEYISNQYFSVRNVLRLIALDDKRLVKYVVCNENDFRIKLEELYVLYSKDSFEQMRKNRNFVQDLRIIVADTFHIPVENEYIRKTRIKAKMDDIEVLRESFFRYKTDDTTWDDVIKKCVFAAYNRMNNVNIEKKDYKKDYKEPENLIYVYYRLTNYCVVNKHNIITVTKKIRDLKTGKMIEVNVFYCRECKKYFINHEVLDGYMKHEIYPAFYYVIEKDFVLNLKDISKLKMYGYSVAEGVTEEWRHRVLTWIIISGIMTKVEIIKDLQFKINYNGNRFGNETAKNKWRADLKFVSRYVMDNKRTVQGKLCRLK